MWLGIVVIVVAGMLTDTFLKNKKMNLKRIEKEIELEKLRLETFEKETEKLKLELQSEKQALLEMQHEK
ncbi:hypothetical protein MHH70_05425 [Metasolibacillus sp. FSL H7-0170]|uniref:hypothetical protein n=1 Tax=Metasolibacillus TaxID=2703677 RepID=UPI0007991141|nr:hypothetical protein [Metasolibacillus fluoroglycofenilyticus]KYG88937.1 hypothetical protein A0U40_14660 [[Bacillus] sp. KCTC 13219]